MIAKAFIHISTATVTDDSIQAQLRCAWRTEAEKCSQRDDLLIVSLDVLIQQQQTNPERKIRRSDYL